VGSCIFILIVFSAPLLTWVVRDNGSGAHSALYIVNLEAKKKLYYVLAINLLVLFLYHRVVN
jgi:hypothetical protein